MRVSIRSDTCLALRLIATQEHYRKTQDWLAMLPELQQRTSTIVQSQSIIETQAAEILRLRAENEKLRAALKEAAILLAKAAGQTGEELFADAAIVCAAAAKETDNEPV